MVMILNTLVIFSYHECCLCIIIRIIVVLFFLIGPLLVMMMITEPISPWSHSILVRVVVWVNGSFGAGARCWS